MSEIMREFIRDLAQPPVPTLGDLGGKVGVCGLSQVGKVRTEQICQDRGIALLSTPIVGWAWKTETGWVVMVYIYHPPRDEEERRRAEGHGDVQARLDILTGGTLEEAESLIHY